MQDCPPPLVQMERSTVWEDGIQHVMALTDTDTRMVEAAYTLELTPPYFVAQGEVQLCNKRDADARIKYRHEATPPIPWRLTGAATGDVCIQGDSVVLFIVESPVEPSETRLVSFYWAAEVRRATDLNNDGTVDSEDLGLFLLHWGTDSASADYNHDGTVNGQDMGLLLMDYGWTMH